MSSINTNGIDVNYPVPGTNNNSQGFRNNFAAIKTNIDTAASEITDLQNKAVLKSALANTTLNNDMANTLISNAVTRSFRSSTYNLGNALAGTVIVNASLGDVIYGNVAENVTLQFGSWAPVGTTQRIVLQLGTSNRDAVISLPPECVSNGSGGTGLLENYQDVNDVSITSFPANVDLITYQMETTDCGNTIYITPLNRPFQSTQIIKRTPPSTGQLGDQKGTMSIGTGTFIESTITSTTSIPATISNATAANPVVITTSAPNLFTDGIQVTITGVVGMTQLNGNSYYVKVLTSTTFELYTNSVLSTPLNGSAFTAYTSGGTATTTPAEYLVTTDTGDYYIGLPVVLTGQSWEPNIIVGTTYYISNIANTTHFKISGNANASGNINLLGGTGNLFLNPVNYMYVAVDDYAANVYTKNILSTTAPNVITLSSSTANIAVNYPVIFAGDVANANLEANNVYYIKSVSGSDITVSKTIDNGVAGPKLEDITTFTFAPPALTMDVYDGQDIFRRIPLLPGSDVPSKLTAQSVNDVKIYGGTNGYVLQTDGSGNLSWVVGSGGGGGSVAGSNTQIQFNDSGSFGASANLTFNKSTNLLSLIGNIGATGNITVGNLTSNANITTSNLTVSSNATFANITISSNVNIGNLSATGNVYATGNVRGGNLLSLGTLSVTGTSTIGGDVNVTGGVTGGLLTSTGDIDIAGNVNTDNVLATGCVFATSNITSSNSVVANLYFVSSVSTTVTPTGSTQGDALDLGGPTYNKQIYIITAVSSGTGVKLPASVPGLRILIRNQGGNPLLVYPPVGSQINALAVNAGYSLANIATVSGIEFICSTSTTWFTL